MSLEALKSTIEAEARIFAETIAKKSVVAFTEELSRSVATGLSTPVATPPAVQDTPKRGRPVTNGTGCKVAGCPRKVIAKGLCSSHYQKARAKARAKEAAKAQPVEQNGASTPATA